MVINFEKLDVASIVANGPFRCVKTKHVCEHLTISNAGQLRIYIDWKRFLMFLDHYLIDEIDSRWRNIAIELLLTYIVLFFRKEFSELVNKSHQQINQGDEINDTVNKSHKRIRQGAKIAESIDVKLSPRVFEELTEVYDYQFSSRATIAPETFVIFGGRLAELTKALEAWKPRKVSELWYKGYGGNDPITLYGFYFSIIIGFVAIFALVLGALQVVFAYKAIYS